LAAATSVAIVIAAIAFAVFAARGTSWECCGNITGRLSSGDGLVIKIDLVIED
jgi:hypothetical protein